MKAFPRCLWLALLLLPAPAHAETQVQKLLDNLTLTAVSLLGTPYVYGGADPRQGLDCSGLVQFVYRQVGEYLPHNALAMSRLGTSVQEKALHPGDLVFFDTLGRPFSHVGIYLGDDRFIHAAGAGAEHVMISRLSDPYWQDHFDGARRLLGLHLPAPAAQ